MILLVSFTSLVAEKVTRMDVAFSVFSLLGCGCYWLCRMRCNSALVVRLEQPSLGVSCVVIDRERPAAAHPRKSLDPSFV